MKKLLIMCLAMMVMFVGVTAAGVIGININTIGGTQIDPANSDGVNYTAGVVPASNWNDLAAGSGVWVPLHDNSGIPIDAAFQAIYSTYAPTDGSVYSTDFANIGDQRMMWGHIYYPSGTDTVVKFWHIPYAFYDVYVYYNSGAVTNNSQTFSIDDTAFSAIGTELTTTRDTAFVLSDGTNDANYVKFSGVNLLDFTLRASSTGSSYSYINGIQIVEVPEPVTGMILLMGVLGFIRRKGFESK